MPRLLNLCPELWERNIKHTLPAQPAEPGSLLRIDPPPATSAELPPAIQHAHRRLSRVSMTLYDCLACCNFVVSAPASISTLRDTMFMIGLTYCSRWGILDSGAAGETNKSVEGCLNSSPTFNSWLQASKRALKSRVLDPSPLSMWPPNPQGCSHRMHADAYRATGGVTKRSVKLSWKKRNEAERN